MFTKTAIALACVICAASGALAATKYLYVNPQHDVYDMRGAYVGSDPDANIRHELRRDQNIRD